MFLFKHPHGSLAEQNLPRGAKVETGLGGTLVGASLQPNQALAGPQLLLGKLAPILLRGPWSQVGPAELRVAVALSEGGEADVL